MDFLGFVGAVALFGLWCLVGYYIIGKQNEARRRQEQERFDELAAPLRKEISWLKDEVLKLKEGL